MCRSGSDSEFLHQRWAQHEEPDQRRSEDGDEDGPGGGIFGLGNEGMNLGDRGIGEALDGGVEDLHGPDEGHGRDQPEPAVPLKAHESAQGHDCDADRQMNPGVVLALHGERDAMDGKLKTSDAFKDREWVAQRQGSPRSIGRLGVDPKVSQNALRGVEMALSWNPGRWMFARADG